MCHTNVFGSYKQNERETMDFYVTRLMDLAETCDFGAQNNERIRDQVVQDCFSDELRRVFLRVPDLTLEKSSRNVRRSSGTYEYTWSGLGAILEQKQADGGFKPITYASRSLADVETSYS